MSNQNIYPATSPYFLTDVVNNKFLDFMVDRPFPKNPDDLEYVIPPVYEYRPDMAAFDFYNDSRLWWVFAARNPNALGPDPYFNFKTGLKIFIPKVEVLKAYLRF